MNLEPPPPHPLSLCVSHTRTRCQKTFLSECVTESNGLVGLLEGEELKGSGFLPVNPPFPHPLLQARFTIPSIPLVSGEVRVYFQSLFDS